MAISPKNKDQSTDTAYGVGITLIYVAVGLFALGPIVGWFFIPPPINWVILGGGIGFAILFYIVVRDRIAESKTDKYKDVKI